MRIRPERSTDFAAIRNVGEASFGRSAEANLIEALRGVAGFDPSLALVAEESDRVVGHILFSPILIESPLISSPALALAPLCVHPEFQNRGLGSGLVLEGLRECRLRRHGIVVVVGEPVYYERFGFQRASLFGVRPPFEVPDEAFMVVELAPDALHGVNGTVRYSAPFEKV